MVKKRKLQADQTAPRGKRARRLMEETPGEKTQKAACFNHFRKWLGIDAGAPIPLDTVTKVNLENWVEWLIDSSEGARSKKPLSKNTIKSFGHQMRKEFRKKLRPESPWSDASWWPGILKRINSRCVDRAQKTGEPSPSRSAT